MSRFFLLRRVNCGLCSPESTRNGHSCDRSTENSRKTLTIRGIRSGGSPGNVIDHPDNAGLSSRWKDQGVRAKWDNQLIVEKDYVNRGKTN